MTLRRHDEARPAQRADGSVHPNRWRRSLTLLMIGLLASSGYNLLLKNAVRYLWRHRPWRRPPPRGPFSPEALRREFLSGFGMRSGVSLRRGPWLEVSFHVATIAVSGGYLLLRWLDRRRRLVAAAPAEPSGGTAQQVEDGDGVGLPGVDLGVRDVLRRTKRGPTPLGGPARSAEVTEVEDAEQVEQGKDEHRGQAKSDQKLEHA
jgi:hypothetical protein